MVEVNQFFCGLHYLVGLADQAEACLKIWESIIHKDRKVGSIAHGGYSNGESGVTRLIRTVCKSVQERGCEKSGKIVGFATYLKDEFGVYTYITSISLILFLVTRFNILFFNAAGVYFLYDQLLDSCFMLFVFVCLWHCGCVVKCSYLARMQPFATILQCIPEC